MCYGVKCWNQLPRCIRMLRDYKLFKKKLKEHLIAHFVESQAIYLNDECLHDIDLAV